MKHDVFPTAQQMRRLQASNENGKATKQKERLKRLLEAAKSENDDSIYLPEKLYEANARYLKELGYEITDDSRDGNYSFTISW